MRDKYLWIFVMFAIAVIMLFENKNKMGSIQMLLRSDFKIQISFQLLIFDGKYFPECLTYASYENELCDKFVVKRFLLHHSGYYMQMVSQ